MCNDFRPFLHNQLITVQHRTACPFISQNKGMAFFYNHFFYTVYRNDYRFFKIQAVQYIPVRLSKPGIPIYVLLKRMADIRPFQRTKLLHRIFPGLLFPALEAPVQITSVIHHSQLVRYAHLLQLINIPEYKVGRLYPAFSLWVQMDPFRIVRCEDGGFHSVIPIPVTLKIFPLLFNYLTDDIHCLTLLFL